MRPPKKLLHEFVYYYIFMQIYASKSKIFNILKNLKTQHLMPQQMGNQWQIQKSKTGHAEYPSLQLLTDFWSNKSKPGAQMCQKNRTFFQWPTAPP